MNWQLKDAGDRFSDVVAQARVDGPQTVTADGERVSVVLSAADYDALRAEKTSLVDHLLSAPGLGLGSDDRLRTNRTVHRAP